MRYLGGKVKIAARLTTALLAHLGRRPVHALELCAGAGGMTVRLAGVCQRVTAIEAHPGLVELLRRVQGGWVPPTSVSREAYAQAQDPADPLHAFIRFGCGYGGAWDTGYCPDEPARTSMITDKARGLTYECRRAPFSHAKSASNSLVKSARPNVTWLAGDGLTCAVPDGVDVVYIDPPYEGTKGYVCVPSAPPGAWWDRAVELATRGLPVYMSEMSHPPAHVRAELVLSFDPGMRRLSASGPRIELLWRVHGAG